MTIGVFVSTVQPMFKNDGSINAAGTLEFYEPGESGSTAKIVYSDYLLTSSIGSIITLDSNGRKVIYLNGDYDLIEKDSAGAIITTRSNINPDQSTSITEPNLISNGSFETSSSNIPVGWTLFEWNAGANVVDDSAGNFADGAYSMKFVSTGSGGGTITTNSFFAVSEYKTYTVKFLLKSTADVRNVVQFLWYDEDQIALGAPSTSIYDEATVNPTNWTLIEVSAAPPAGARFAKLKIIGCDSSDSTSGTARFDGVTVRENSYILVSNSSGGAVGPSLELYRNSASPAGSDILGEIIFYGEDSAGNKQVYGRINTLIDDPASTSEDSHIRISALAAGVETISAEIGPGIIIGSPAGSFKGTGTLNATSGLYVNNDPVATLAANNTFSGIETFNKEIVLGSSTEVATEHSFQNVGGIAVYHLPTGGVLLIKGPGTSSTADRFKFREDAGFVCADASGGDSPGGFKGVGTINSFGLYDNGNRTYSASNLVVTAGITDGAVTTAKLADTSINQVKMSTSRSSVFQPGAGAGHFILPGGQYGFYPQLTEENAGSGPHSASILSSFNMAAGDNTIIYLDASAAGGSEGIYAYQRYVDASPPYNLGDGDVPLFVFAEVDAIGNVSRIYVAPEAPWHHNGPTNIQAQRYDAQGRGYRKVRRLFAEHGSIKAARAAGLSLAQIAARLADDPLEEMEITQAIKQADMPLLPHPFIGNDLTGKTIILLDPVSPFVERLFRLHEVGESISELLHTGDIKFANTALPRSGPPGVVCVAPRWKLTL